MPDDTDVDTEDAILAAKAEGKPIREIARHFSLTAAQAEKSLKAALDRLQSGEGLRRSVGLALHRLEQMEVKYHSIAMAAPGGDPACAVVALKANERRSVLSGVTPPQGYAVTMISNAAPPEQTSTQRLLSIFDSIKGVSVRERALLNRQRDAELEPGELAELEQLQREREAGRRAN
jgi:hypothetical protein